MKAKLVNLSDHLGNLVVHPALTGVGPLKQSSTYPEPWPLTAASRAKAGPELSPSQRCQAISLSLGCSTCGLESMSISS